jgi:hypothetical protein
MTEMGVSGVVDVSEDVDFKDEPYDFINPAHYKSHPSGIECKDVVQWMSFNIGTAIKHLWRIGLKPGTSDIQELEKARTYLQFEIDRLKKLGEENRG